MTVFSTPLLRRMFINQRKIISLAMLLAFTIEFLFTFIMATSTIRKFAESYFKLIPPMIKQMMGFMGENIMGSQFIAFGYTHPAIVFLLAFIPVSIAARYITAEIENRSIELLAIRILPRRPVVLSSYLFIISALASVFFAMMCGSLAGRAIMDIQSEFSLVLLLKISATGLLFFGTLAAIVTFIATTQNERGKALSWSIGTILLLFIFDALIRLWPKIAFLKPYSFFNWYQPVNIATSTYNYPLGLSILFSILILFLGLSVYHFSRRDL